MALSERERRFVEAYMGQAAGNATDAAKSAGYKAANARQQGCRLLTKANVQAAITERVTDDPQIADRTARQRLWSDIAFGRGDYREAALKDRLKASELLGKSQADFIERHAHEGKDGKPLLPEGASFAFVVAQIPGSENRT